MLKKKLLLALALLVPSYCYSDSITPYYGQTGNAVSLGSGLTWNMGNVFPSGIPGLDVNAVIYSYTPIKRTEDGLTVHVQNENANGTGYIFRSTDDWKPGSIGGIEIRRVVPVIPGIPREAWGTGSIQTEGQGSVTDASVVYNYRVDPCYDPQYDPNCPGYKQPVPNIYELDLTTIYDPTKDSNVQLDRSVNINLIKKTEEKELSEKEKKEKEEKEKEESKERLEKALAAADSTALFAQALASSQMLATMNMAVNMNSYYSASIPGGTYRDSVVLVDKKLPENKRGLRNGLAQQLLHNKMVEMQYDR